MPSERNSFYETLIDSTLKAIGLTGHSIQRDGRHLTINEDFKAFIPTQEELFLRTKAILESFLSAQVSKHLPAQLDSFIKRNSTSLPQSGGGREFKTEEILSLYFRYLERYKQPLESKAPPIEEQVKVTWQFFHELKEIGGFRVYKKEDEYALAYSLKPRTIYFFYLGLMKFHFHYPRTNQSRHFGLSRGYDKFIEIEDYSMLNEIIEKEVKRGVEADDRRKREAETRARDNAIAQNAIKVFQVQESHGASFDKPIYRSFRMRRP